MKDFLNRMKAGLARLMVGRYGPDKLYKGLIGLSLVLLVLSWISAFRLFYYLSLFCLIYASYRAFSKDRVKRARENQVYLQKTDQIKKQFLLLKNRVKEYKTHRYRACPHCKTTLRLPKKIGTLHGTCPVCKKDFELTIKH